ncbi:MAG: hypothetical protein MUF49_27440 [Oculatellaceae cyanobacterium Prado106]|jgi:tetratricopeptide (TPR) repeat protein|nr:hypothetical protein [Oculatellaceae cyanobacterium Prado106]
MRFSIQPAFIPLAFIRRAFLSLQSRSLHQPTPKSHFMIWFLVICLGMTSSPALARESRSEDTLPNPLELTEPDPLLPTLAVDRPLSPQERRVLATALDELQAQATAKFNAGDTAGAFEIWTRELRLRRFLGPEEEVRSLSRVGEVAWSQSQTTEVRFITQRLQTIEQEQQLQSPPDYGLLLQIAEAYQKMRARLPAVALYGQLLTRAQAQKNVAQQEQILTALGDLHLSWFDYPNAAIAYQQLGQLQKAQGNEAGEVQALQTLADIYQRNNQPEQAIAPRQRLVEIYRRKQDVTQIAIQKLAIGDAYLALNRPDQAATSYQEAFAVSRSAQQYGYGSEALQRLASIYQSLNRPNDVLFVYQLLLDVQQQSYDTLGMMNTYDLIGQVQRTQGNSAEATNAFRQGLQLAQQLKYKVEYFTSQLQAATP